MLFAIHAFEQRYGGLYGIEDYAVIEEDSYDEAVNYAREMSIDVISKYLYDEFEEEAEEDFNWYNNEDEYDKFDFDDYVFSHMEEDIDYEIWQVKDDTGYSLDALSNMFYNNPDEFVKNYCNEWE